MSCSEYMIAFYFLIWEQDVGLPMVTFTCIVADSNCFTEICVLNWLRQHTLCYAPWKCLLFTFWDGSGQMSFLVAKLSWVACKV